MSIPRAVAITRGAMVRVNSGALPDAVSDRTQASEGILLAAGSLFSPDGRPSTWTRINVAAAESKALVAALKAAHRDLSRHRP